MSHDLYVGALLYDPCRWNVRRKWKMSMLHHYDTMTEQEQVLDEAYLDALEQKVWTDKLHIFMWSRQV